MERILFVGSYAPTGKPGIQTLQLNDQTGGLRCVSSFSSIERPSYLALSPDEKTLYAVSETVSGGSVYAFAVGTDGSLLPRNFLPTSGSAVCHLTVDPQGNFLSGCVSPHALRRTCYTYMCCAISRFGSKFTATGTRACTLFGVFSL